jgi:hypothetical protein
MLDDDANERLKRHDRLLEKVHARQTKRAAVDRQECGSSLQGTPPARCRRPDNRR